MISTDRPAGALSGASPATAARPAHAHVRPLDGLRGFAILLVIVPHLASAGFVPGPAAVQHAIASIAHGVDLFFVLSGFGLAYPLLERYAAGQAVRFDAPAYAFNRLYRILPPFYIAIAFAYAVAAVAGRTGRLKADDLLFVPHTLYATIAPLLLLDRLNLPINPNLWTIAIQMRWYLVFPLLLALWLASPRAFAAVLGAAWVGYLFTRERSIDLGTLPLFMLGIVAADLIVRRRPIATAALVAFPVAVAVALAWDPHAMVPDPWGSDGPFLGQPTSFGWHVAAFALVLIAARCAPAMRLFSSPPLVALGAASFSIYLVHQPVLALVLALYGPHAGALAFAAALGAGFVFWWCVERPIADPARRRRLRERALPFVGRAFRWLGLPVAPVLASR